MQFCVRVKENSVIVDKVEPSTHVDKECQTWVTEPRRTATFKGDVILDTSKSCAMKMADDTRRTTRLLLAQIALLLCMPVMGEC